MITHLTVSHFKSISELDISLSPINVVVGPNGVGKSNIVDALYFLHDCVTEDLDTAILKRHGIESIRQWSKTRPFHISIEIDLQSNEQHGSYKIVLASARGAYRVIEESGYWYGPNIYERSNNKSPIGKTTFDRDSAGNVKLVTDFSPDPGKDRRLKLPLTELFITLLNGPVFSMEGLYLKGLSDQIKSFVSYSIYPNTLREPRVASRQDQLLSDGSNLASIIRIINSGHRKNKEQLVEALQVLMPSLTDILVKSAGGYYVPVVAVSEPSGDVHQFNMSQLSDGTLRVLGLLSAFYQPNAPNIIALEEPEQMIHPGALPILAESSREFVSGNKNRQIFLTTHSPPLLALFQAEDIIWTTFSAGKTKAGRIGKRQLELIKSQLFTPGEVLLSEGFLEQ